MTERLPPSSRKKVLTRKFDCRLHGPLKIKNPPLEKETGIPFDNILINATHTHHAPTTVTIHGYEREEGFTKQLEEKIVAAAVAANHRTTPVEFRFRLGEESSVGKNSRLLLEDGTIYWTGLRALPPRR